MKANPSHDLPLSRPLTTRELEVLACIAKGLNNRQIAQHLVLAISTVKWYIRQIYNKLSVYDRQEAITRAHYLGLVSGGQVKNAIQHNLQPAATPFVGRHQELDALSRFIADPQQRIITIVGPGGMGKTRLALEMAWQQVGPISDFTDGVFFVELASLATAPEVITTLAALLNFRFRKRGSEKEQLFNFLRAKNMLFIMDNFEQILDGPTLVAEMSMSAANVKFLITSREPLHLQGEQRFPLQGLILPPAQQLEFLLSDAAKLFLTTAQRVDPSFELFPQDVERVQQICRLVGGMPLGIELAASWVGLISLAAIAADIEQSLNLLRSQNHDLPQRHRSMQASLESSWQRLSPEQKFVSQKLTVFKNGFTRAAALAVAGASLPILVTLVNKSWLAYNRHDDRYSVHELLRQFGQEKLADSEQAQRLHSHFFLDRLSLLKPMLQGEGQQIALAEIKTELDNIRSAWKWGVRYSFYMQMYAAMDSIGLFFLILARYTEGGQIFQEASDSLSDSFNDAHIKLTSLFRLTSRSLIWQSQFRLFTHSAAEAIQLLEMSRSRLDALVLEEQDVLYEQAFMLLIRGDARFKSGNVREAREDMRRSLYLYRKIDDQAGVAKALFFLSDLVTANKEYHLARQYLEESLVISQKNGDQYAVAQAWNGLAENTRYAGGGAETALCFYDQGLAELRVQDNQWGIRFLSAQKGYLAFSTGQFETAVRCLQLCKNIDNKLGSHDGTILIVLGAANWYAGHTEIGYRDLNDGVRTFERQGRFRRLMWAKAHVAIIDAFSGNYSQARLQAEEVLTQTAFNERISGRAYALIALSWVELVQGRFHETINLLVECDLLLTHPTAPESAPETLGWAWVIMGGALYGLGYLEQSQQKLYHALESGVSRRSFVTLLYWLPIMALVLAANKEQKRQVQALELYALAQSQTFILKSQLFNDIAGPRLQEVRTSLPQDMAAAAVARGRKMNVWATAESLLSELKNISNTKM